jgi:hypothetical protein
MLQWWMMLLSLFPQNSILFEYIRYMACSNEITRHLWEIVRNSDTTTKEKTNALSCLMQSYNSRLRTLTARPELYMNIKKVYLKLIYKG